MKRKTRRLTAHSRRWRLPTRAGTTSIGLARPALGEKYVTEGGRGAQKPPHYRYNCLIGRNPVELLSKWLLLKAENKRSESVQGL